MDHLSDCEFRRDDSNARSILIDLRKTVLRVFALAGFSRSQGHVWTAPPWQELSDVCAALVGCGHVSGLFVRR